MTPITSEDLKLKNDTAGRQFYEDYQSSSEFMEEPNCLYLLKAEDPPTNPALLATYEPYVKIQLGPPTRRRIVTVKASRTGAPPLMPKPTDQGRFKYEGGSLTYAQPQPHTDGVSAIWNSLAVYTFVENALPSYYQGYVLGETPFALEAYEYAKESRYSALLGAPGLRETTPGPRLGEAMGQIVDHTQRNLGLDYTNGAYSVMSYVPATFLSDTLLSGGYAVAVPPPPASPPP